MQALLVWISIAVLSCNEHSQGGNVKNANHDTGSNIRPTQNDTLNRKRIVLSAQMHAARATHTATLLKDGKVLICGGFSGNSSLPSAELYDPVLNLFKNVGNMSVPRSSHTASLLPGGKVLIAGGYNGKYLSSTEIYDPATETFTVSNDLTIPRSGHTATLLNTGKILFTGGVGTGWTFLESAEVYDTQTGKFVATGSMTVPRESHTATLLHDGTVLVTGGHKGRRADIEIFSSAELYDPSKATFAATGNMTILRHKHDAVTLADGNVLITGGSDHRDSRGTYNSTEIYNPVTHTFSRGSNMKLAHYKHNGTSILLSNGNVLIAAGANHAELFDAKNKAFSIVNAKFPSERLFACATLLANEDILITGGYDEHITASSTAFLFTNSKN